MGFFIGGSGGKKYLKDTFRNAEYSFDIYKIVAEKIWIQPLRSILI